MKHVGSMCKDKNPSHIEIRRNMRIFILICFKKNFGIGKFFSVKNIDEFGHYKYKIYTAKNTIRDITSK